VAAARVILLEVPMPEIAGVAFAKERHTYTARRPIPIVVMTGKDLMTKERQCLNGLVTPVLRTREDSREALLNKVHGLVTTYARHKAARDTAQPSKS
jgi:CheY-like chemotaxis protein